LRGKVYCGHKWLGVKGWLLVRVLRKLVDDRQPAKLKMEPACEVTERGQGESPTF